MRLPGVPGGVLPLLSDEQRRYLDLVSALVSTASSGSVLPKDELTETTSPLPLLDSETILECVFLISFNIEVLWDRASIFSTFSAPLAASGSSSFLW